MRHGFLLIDKPIGPTSHDVVSTVRRTLHEQKIGHLGTLDPQASGLLVLAVGAKALKVIEFFQDAAKEYEAQVEFGAVSTTYDSEGNIDRLTPKPGWHPPDDIQLRRLLEERFIGKIQQVPPAYSAVHTPQGRAYTLARKGESVSLAPRNVEISRCDILRYEYPHLVLHIACSTGTYIRSLAHDLGQSLRCGGYLSALRRTRVGEWTMEHAADPEKVIWSDVIPLKDVLTAFNSIELTSEEHDHIRHGRKIAREVKPDTLGWYEGLPVVVLTPAKDGSRMAQPRKVL